jgi:hypothetical protein
LDVVRLYPADDRKHFSSQDTRLFPDSLCPLEFATAFLMGGVRWQHWVQKGGGHEGMQVTKYHWKCTNDVYTINPYQPRVVGGGGRSSGLSNDVD